MACSKLQGQQERYIMVLGVSLVLTPILRKDRFITSEGDIRRYDASNTKLPLQNFGHSIYCSLNTGGYHGSSLIIP
ncbi:hypothetical protein EJB05_06037, partial [Eragrostis curvula]